MIYINKYRNIKTKIDNIEFDSKAEARRYIELKLLQRANKIKDLELQPRFLLQDSFSYKGKRIRKIEYIADFKYVENEKEVVEDVKGHKTKEYLIKKKLFMCKYPTIEFREKK